MKTTAMKHNIISADGNWNLPAPRKYLDEFADEYKTTTIEEKINALGLYPRGNESGRNGGKIHGLPF